MKLLAPTIALALSAPGLIAEEPKGYKLGRDLVIPAGPHEVVQVLKVKYWPERPPLPEALANEDTEYRPFFNYFAPKGPERPLLPGIILIHGGGFGSGHPDQFHTKYPLAPLLASRGYVVFSLGYTLRNRTTRRVAAIDLRQAIRFIRKNADWFGVDPDRLGAWGFSAGGMTMGQMLKMPENATIKERYQTPAGENVTEELPTDGGPLAESRISTRLQVMIFSSGHEVRTDQAEKKVAEFAGRAPDAIFLYQSPGEKPQCEGAVPADHPMRKAYESLGTYFEGYGVVGGKHCPNLRLTVPRDGKEIPLHQAIFDFLDERLDPILQPLEGAAPSAPRNVPETP